MNVWECVRLAKEHKYQHPCKWNLKNSRIKYHYIERTVKQKIDYNKQNKYYNNTDDKQGQIW